MFGLPEALLVAAARSVLAALISGKLLGIPFLLSLSGGLVSALVMGLLFRRTDGLGIVGVSILGSFAHNVAQLLVVYFLLMHNSAILILLPVLWLAALATGTGVGYAAAALLNTTPVKNYLSDEGAGDDIQDIKQE